MVRLKGWVEGDGGRERVHIPTIIMFFFCSHQTYRILIPEEHPWFQVRTPMKVYALNTKKKKKKLRGMFGLV